jgi:hypothetical protein
MPPPGSEAGEYRATLVHNYLKLIGGDCEE